MARTPQEAQNDLSNNHPWTLPVLSFIGICISSFSASAFISIKSISLDEKEIEAGRTLKAKYSKIVGNKKKPKH